MKEQEDSKMTTIFDTPLRKVQKCKIREGKVPTFTAHLGPTTTVCRMECQEAQLGPILDSNLMS